MTTIERLRNASEYATYTGKASVYTDRDLLRAAAEELESLQAENAALRKDKERLDWIICNPSTFFNNWMYSTFMPKDCPVKHRNAIDAAMTQ